ncbi:MAG: TetR/AcrR family transcriptional regulator [Planctomycetales bacterium]|nr:TetR/AcrR family transcriptional regulator [Planctomycetales bacterium]
MTEPITLSPKQAEIRSRESRILQLARPMVARQGLAGLSMEAIAKEMAYAKGTIYNHFACKEEILLALAIQANEKRLELFMVATEKAIRSRDKISAIGVACEDFRVRFPDLFEIDSMVRHSTVWEKASQKRREMMAVCEQRCMGMVSEIGRESIANGDLILPTGTGIEDIVFGLWSLTYGGMIINDSSPGLDQIGIRDSFAAIRRNCHALMDGFRWQPLYDAQADQKLVRSVRATLKRKVPQGVIVTASDGKVAERQQGGAER